MENQGTCEEKSINLNKEYPKINRILKQLYASGYRSGDARHRDIPNGDGYDHSSAYTEIEREIKNILSLRILRDGLSECEQKIKLAKYKEIIKKLSEVINLIIK